MNRINRAVRACAAVTLIVGIPICATWLTTSAPRVALANSGGTVTNRTITICTPSGGTIGSSPSGSTFPSGTNVTLTARPAEGYVFTGWSGGISGSQNPVTFPLNANMSVCATFATAASLGIPTFSINICGPSGTLAHGSVSKNPNYNIFVLGTQAQVEAHADLGYVFVGWTGDLNGLQNPTSLSMIQNYNICADIRPSPAIVIYGDAPLTMECGDSYAEPGVIALDDLDGNITTQIAYSGDLNTSTPGTYSVIYDVVDSDNHTAHEVRTVTVADTAPPELTLLGSSPLTLDFAANYVDPGVEADDHCEGDLTSNIIVGGDEVAPFVPGEYVVIYDVTDASINHAQQTRTVKVTGLAEDLDYACTFFRGAGNTDCSVFDSNAKEEGTPSGTFVNAENGIPDRVEFDLLDSIFADTAHPRRQEILDAWLNNLAEIDLYLQGVATQHPSAVLPDRRARKALAAYTVLGEESHFLANTLLQAKLNVSTPLETSNFEFPTGLAYDEDFDGDGYSNLQEWEYAEMYAAAPEEVFGEYIAAALDPSNVIFPDAVLDALVRTVLGISHGFLYEADLVGTTPAFDTLVDLNTDDQPPRIADLTGLDRCTDLTSVRLARQDISNLSPLHALTNLEILELSVNNISDVSPLDGLSNLKDLRIGINPLSDISPLGELDALEWLGLPQTEVTDVAPLVGLPNLTFLNLDYLTISNLAALAPLSSLETLRLNNTNTTRLAPLSTLAATGALTQLYINTCPLANEALCDDIPYFQNNGVTVNHDGNICQRFLTVTHSSGGNVKVNGTTYTTGPLSIDLNESVQLRGVPNSGYAFKTWQGALTATTNPSNLAMADNANVHAVFEQIYKLNAVIKDSANAVIDVSPASPPNAPSKYYFAGEEVTLTATENQTWDFIRWEDGSGNPLSSSLTYQVTMNADKTVVAVFKTYALTVQAENTAVSVHMGEIELTPGPDNEWGLPEGKEVTISAAPVSGHKFSYWEDSNGEVVQLEPSITLDGSAASPLSFSAHSVANTKAELVVFMPAAWQSALTPATAPLTEVETQYTNGANENKGKSKFQFTDAGDVVLSLDPQIAGDTVVWKTLSGVIVGTGPSYTCLRAKGESKVVFVETADMDEDYFGVEFASVGNGIAYVDNIAVRPDDKLIVNFDRYEDGISLSAKADAGWSFVGWKDTLANDIASSAGINTAIAHQNLDIDGDGKVLESDLTIVRNVLGGASPGVYDTDVDNNSVSDEEDLRQVGSAVRTHTVVAVFEAVQQYTLSATASPTAGGNIVRPQTEFTPGSLAVIEAIPAEGYYFNGWTGTLNSDSQSLVHEMTSNVSLTAHFHVEDRPVITLYGSDHVELQPDEYFYDPGAFAEDINGNDISDRIRVSTIEGKPGIGWTEYRYSVRDTDGRSAVPISRFVMALGTGVDKGLSTGEREQVCANCDHEEFVRCYVKKVPDGADEKYECIDWDDWSEDPDPYKLDPSDTTVVYPCSELICQSAEGSRPDSNTLNVSIEPANGGGEYAVTTAGGRGWLADTGYRFPIFPFTQPWHDHSHQFEEANDASLELNARVKAGQEDSFEFDYWELNDHFVARERITAPLRPKGSEATAHFRSISAPSEVDPDELVFFHSGLTALVEPGFEEYADIALFYSDNNRCVGKEGRFFAPDDACWSDYQEATERTVWLGIFKTAKLSVVPAVQYDEDKCEFLGWERKENNATQWECGEGGLCDPGTETLGAIEVPADSVVVYMARFSRRAPQNPSCTSIDVNATVASNPPASAGKTADSTYIPTDEAECRFKFRADELDFFRWTIEIDIPSNKPAEKEVLNSVDVGSNVFEVSLPVGTASFTATAHYHDGPWGDTSDPNDQEDNPQFMTDSVCEESSYGTVSKQVSTASDGSQTATFAAESDGKATFEGWEITNDLGVESDLTGIDLTESTITINTMDVNGEQGKHIRYTVTATYENCVPPECASIDAEPEVEGCGTADVIYTSYNGACKLVYKAEPTKGQMDYWIGWDTDGDLGTVEEEELEFDRIGAPAITPTAIFVKCDEAQDPEQESVTDECPVVEETAETESDPEKADPIYWYSGELYELARDIEIEGKGIGISWTRKYRSRIAKEHVLGNNWDHSYNIYLTRSSTLGNTDFVLHRGLHRVERFKDNGNGTWSYGERGDKLTMREDQAGTKYYQLVGSGEVNYVFNNFDVTNAPGKLTSIVNRYGDAASLGYLSNGRLSTVTDTQGNVLTLTYDAGGRITKAEVKQGSVLIKRVDYEYYASGIPEGNPGDLKTVKVVSVYNASQKLVSAEYTYYLGSTAQPELKHNLRTISRYRASNDKRVVVENTYGTSGYMYDRVTQQRWGDASDIVNLHYQPYTSPSRPGVQTVTILNDRKGNITEFYYDGSHRLREKNVHDNPGADPAVSPAPNTVNPTTLKANRFASGGFSTKYKWNTSGRLETITYPSNREKEYVYATGSSDPQARLTVKEVKLKASATDPDPLITQTGYRDCGCGQLDYSTDPNGNRTDYSYNELYAVSAHGIPQTRTTSSEVDIYPPAPFAANSDYTARVTFGSTGRALSKIHAANDIGGHKRSDSYYYGDSVSTPDTEVLSPLQVLRVNANAGGSAGETETTTITRDRLGRLVGIDITEADWQANTFVPGVDPGTKIVYDGFGRVSKIIQSIGGPTATYTQEIITYYTDGLPMTRTITEYGHSSDLVLKNYYAIYTYDILGMLTLKKEGKDSSNATIETHYAYDENRNLREVRSGSAGSTDNNHVETYQYNSRDLLGRRFIGGEGNPKAVEVNYRYDADGNLESTQWGGATSPKENTYAYDAYGRLNKISMPENVTQRFWHDRNGNVTDAISVGPETKDGAVMLLAYTKYEYDELDRVIRTRKLKENVARTYTETVDPPTLESPTWFDQKYAYTPNSQIKQITSNSGYAETMTYTYDGMNRVKSIEDAKGNKNTFTYDSRSYLAEILEDAISDAPGGTDQQFNTTILRDFLGRSYQVANDANETTLFERDRYGNVLRKIEPGQSSTTGTIQEFDALGRLVHVKSTLPGVSGGATTYIHTYHTWDDSSRKRTSKDPSNGITTYEYNALSQLEYVRQKYQGTTEFQIENTYNEFGELENVQDANGTVSVLGYDNLGRLVSRTVTPGSSAIVNSGNESFVYDGLSRVIEANKGGGVSLVTRKYDTLSNLTEETLTKVEGSNTYPNTSTFAWDGLGNITSMGYPGGRNVAYDYNDGARLDTIVDSILSANNITYGHLGQSRTESVSLSASLSIDVAYDTASRVSGIDYKTGSTTLYNMDFDWTPRGNLDALSLVTGGIPSGTGSKSSSYDWDYDNAERLTSSIFDLNTASSGDEKSTNYVLLPAGAHQRVQRTAGTFTANNVIGQVDNNFPDVYLSYVVDGASSDVTWHEVVDDNGNRTNFYPGSSTTGGHTYIYDQDNRLVSYSDLNDVVTTYTYDAFGRRIDKTTGGNTTRYVYAGWDVIQERNGTNGLLRSFLLNGQSTDGVVAMTTHNPASGAATASYFYLKDARGNVVALATPGGTIVERYVYDAYGQPKVYDVSWNAVSGLSTVGNPYFFQSRNFDSESGLYYFRLRYMDPLVGRFITPDPIGNWGDAKNLGNPYTFVGNNPWTFSEKWTP